MDAWPPRARTGDDNTRRPARGRWWRKWRIALVACVTAFALLGAESGCPREQTAKVSGILAGDIGAAPFGGNFGLDVLGLSAEVSSKKLSGDTPGLFGGTNKQSVCDKAKLIAFLAVNALPAARFVKILRLAGTARIPQYVQRLTPVILRVDTLVRNHTMDSSFDAILQAGTAVLIDEFGVPVIKCNCGNPLTEAKKDPGRIKLKTPDKSWEKKGSKPTKIGKPKTKAAAFVVKSVTDPDRGLRVTPGSDGGQDPEIAAPPPLPKRDDKNKDKESPSGTPSDDPSATGTETGPTPTGSRGSGSPPTSPTRSGTKPSSTTPSKSPSGSASKSGSTTPSKPITRSGTPTISAPG